MSIVVLCPGCGVKLSAPDSTVGLPIRCPKCQTSVTVPEPAEPDPISNSPLPLNPVLPPPIPPAALILPDEEPDSQRPPPRRRRGGGSRHEDQRSRPGERPAREPSLSPSIAARRWKLVAIGSLLLLAAHGVFALAMLPSCATRVLIVRSDEGDIRGSLNTIVTLMIVELVLKLLALMAWMAGRVFFSLGPPGQGRALALTSAGIAGGGFLLSAIGILILVLNVRTPSTRLDAGAIVVGALLPILGFGLAIAAEYVAIVAQMGFARRWRDRRLHSQSKIQLIGLSVLLAGFVAGFCLFRGVSNLAETKDEEVIGYAKIVTRKKDPDTEAALVVMTGFWLVVGVGGYCAWSALTHFTLRNRASREAEQLQKAAEHGLVE